jgi:hypothetical protein
MLLSSDQVLGFFNSKLFKHMLAFLGQSMPPSYYNRVAVCRRYLSDYSMLAALTAPCILAW